MIHIHKTHKSTRFGKLMLAKLFLFILPLSTFAQTCPVGSPTASTGYGVSASGGASGAANAVAAFLSSGSTLNGSNSAVSSTTTPLVIDFQRWVAQSSTLTIAWARSSGTPAGTISYSNDGVTYTTLGTLSGSASSSSIYTNFTVPSGGLRYIRITGTAGVFFVDGIRSTHYCYHNIEGVKDTRVVLSPGRAKGNVALNDLNIDNGAKSYSLYSGVSNGTLTFNSSADYTYIPNSGFEGVDLFSYIVSDAGPDGNMLTTGDNGRDTTTVTLRTLFNCDSSTFFVPIPENEAIDFLKDISPSGANSDPTNVYIGISVASDAIVIYDHWEDGFESDIKSPSQSSTQIWGDGDLTNGIAPGFPTDILDAGKAIVLSNSLTSGHTGSTSYNPNAAASDATLLATVDYDGKDKVFIGGVGAMSKLMWGTLGTASMCGSSVPATKKWGTSYTLPVGINTANSGTSFQITSLSILAKENGTTVTIDRDANGSTDITITLAQGETYYLDSRFSGSAVAVNQGARINATKDIMVSLMTGQYNTLPYQSRTFALTPNAQLSTCYYMPAVPSESIRVFFYNPTGSAITVTRTTTGGATSTINVPANSSNYNDVNSSGQGYRYCSTVAFSILSVVDYNSGNSDWGFIPVSSTNMTSKVLVGYGDGEDPLSGTLGTNNYTQAMVTVACNTYLYVDLNGDGVADRVSFNADVDATDNSVAIGGVNYNETTSNNGIYLQAYQTVTIGSTTGSLNGAVIWTKTAANNTGSAGCNLSLVWGQNGGPTTTPNIDAGYTVPNIQTDIDRTILKTSDSIIVQRGLDSIRVNFTGAVSPFKVFWFNETTNTYSVFNTPDSTFVINDLEPGNYLIKLKDNNCRTFSQRVIIYEIPSAPVSGRIYHDPDGLTDGVIDGTPIGTLAGSRLYAYLVTTTGVVFDSAKVLNNGTFSLRGRQSWNYSVRISDLPASFYAAAPSVHFASGWANVAEQFGTSNAAGSGFESGTANGIVSTGISSSAITSANFSVERLAFAHNKTYNIPPDSVLKYQSGIPAHPYYISLINSSGTADTTVTGMSSSIMPGLPSGSDYEDGRFRGATGANAKFVITSLPDSSTNGFLSYNGIRLHNNPQIASAAYAYWNAAASRYEIPSFNPSLLILYVKAAYQNNTQFNYSYLDNANMLGQVATYRINFLTPLPMKVVFNGKKEGTVAVLEWHVFNKENVAAYELERTSPDGNTIIIATIEDNGTDNYTVPDDLNGLKNGTYTYALYTIETDGSRTYRGNAEFDNTKGEVRLFANPNPATGVELGITLDGFDERTTKSIELYNATGQIIETVSFQGNYHLLDVSSYAEGTYFLKVYDKVASTTATILVRR